ncbi:uncharacterized protein ARMOST_15801 [Armillaria ostoyae]|uniref:CxC2-like cysteine cluster KDZ transposase-associated domain-containing protein n=1 Tax=Armillaria ostoyae TaxID=47428 RepID=A0A284RUI5_ARMOS|nr:uncharacterized protein ARMOST_15801 [Armillaria ostoyae]
MWNYNPKKHGKSGPAWDVTVSDGTNNQPSAPATERYQHTHFSTKTKARPTGEWVRPSIRRSTVTLAALESEHPVTEDLYPSIADLSSGSFLDPDYVPSAKDHLLLVWSSQRSEFLNKILKLDAFKTEDNACEVCKVDSGLFRCLSCVDTRCLCQTCMVAAHEGLPLHRIEEWCSSFFRKTTLAQLGLKYELGHEYRTPCLFPAIVPDFVVVDTEGIHTVNMAFCNCTQGIPWHIQLLRQRLFPVTTIYPHSAFTFRVLHLFQLLSFMSKVSAYEFYHTLARLTDNSGMHAPPDRYQAFLRVLREWRHIRALKRFGHGHEPEGIQGTKQGKLALRCPACPQPSINLPPDWNQNLATRWLYRLFLAIDANFRLHRLNVSSDRSDPGLNLGYAYFVDETAFRNHIDMFGKVIPEEEKSTCNNHNAVKLANSRGGHGAMATGVGAVVCGRHDMKRPLSVGDLQKGERYLNMDYFVLSTLTDDTPPDLVISYDIACQWHKNFFARISEYPELLRPKQLERNILYLVPKFHLPAHILKCRDDFSFNFSAKVGRTDGEAPERGWAATNALAASTKGMGPGARRDTLDDHFGDYNWRKIITLAETLCGRLKEAVKARLEHVEEFIGYEDALQAEHSESVHSWRQIVLLWESDRTQPNPFSPTLRPVTENAVRLELARQEKIASAVEIRHDVSPSELIAQGLQLEEAQVRLQCDINALGSHSTDLQRTKVQAQDNRIQRKIEAWIEVQKIYMPRTTLLRTRDEDRRAVGTTVPPSKIPLYLPSAALRLNAIDLTTQSTVVDNEWQLRIAQANDTLAALREHLLLKSYLTAWRQRFSRGQRYGTKANTLFHRVEAKIAANVAKYQRIYKALSSMSVKLQRSEWQGILRPLKNEDVRGLDQYNELTSEGHRNLAWIWKTNLQGGDKGLQEALRMEWCKSRARAQRWQEECDLLIEELRRVQVTFACYAKQWTKRAEFSLLPGARAYAFRQAALWSELHADAEAKWLDIQTSLDLNSSKHSVATTDLDNRIINEVDSV